MCWPSECEKQYVFLPLNKTNVPWGSRCARGAGSRVKGMGKSLCWPGNQSPSRFISSDCYDSVFWGFFSLQKWQDWLLKLRSTRTQPGKYRYHLSSIQIYFCHSYFCFCCLFFFLWGLFCRKRSQRPECKNNLLIHGHGDRLMINAGSLTSRQKPNIYPG